MIIGTLAAFLTNIGWRNAFGLLGAANLVIAVPLILAALKAWPGTAAESAAESARGDAEEKEKAEVEAAQVAVPLGPPSVMRSGQFWLLVVLYAVCGFQDFFMATHVVAFAQDSGIGRCFRGIFWP